MKKLSKNFAVNKHQHRLIPNNTVTRMQHVCLFYASKASMLIYCKYKTQCTAGTAKHC